MAAKLKVDELRAELSQRGLSTAGAKPALVKRLTSAMRKEAKSTDESGVVDRKRKREGDEEEVAVDLVVDGGDGGEVKSEDVKEEVEEKFVKATKKGGAVLDQWLPDHVKEHYHMMSQGDEIFDAVLNQTNVGNNNKFYVIQVLQSDDGSGYMVYNRFGRVGVRGQDKLHSFTSREAAVNFYTSFWIKQRTTGVIVVSL